MNLLFIVEYDYGLRLTNKVEVESDGNFKLYHLVSSYLDVYQIPKSHQQTTYRSQSHSSRLCH